MQQYRIISSIQSVVNIPAVLLKVCSVFFLRITESIYLEHVV